MLYSLSTKLSNSLLLDVFEDDEAVILTGSGKYTRDSDDIPKMLVKLDVLKEMIFNAENNSDPDDLVVYHLNNYKKAKEFFDDEKIENIVISIDYKDDYGARRLAAGFSTLIFAVVLLVSSFVSYYFVLRSSLLSRIYEISVYRALGASKLDLVKIFLSEILLVTTLTSLPGYILSAYIFYSIQEAGGGIVEYMNYSLISMTLGVLFVYAINIFSGLLPVTNLLRKTPAEILSRYDF